MSEQSVAADAFVMAKRALHELDFPNPRMFPPLTLELANAPLQKEGTRELADLSRVEWVSSRVPVLSEGPTLTEALAHLAAGKTTSRELVELAISAMERTTELGTVVDIDPTRALSEADTCDAARAAGAPVGPLHGIPITVKDIIDVAGFTTGAGSLAYEDQPIEDAVAVARLRDAGAIILAKVATHEFALGVTTPQCRNPHDATRISGGSSGGSAIAVATGVGLASLGTDTRASLRVPSALCGVSAFKPTYGRVPAKGIVPLSWTIDVLGPIARTVEDAATVLNVLADKPFIALGGSTDISGMVIGIAPGVFEDADPDVARTCLSALLVLERLGCSIVAIPGPTIEDLELSNALGLLVSRSEAIAVHRALGTNLELCIPEVHDQLLAALDITAADYLDAQRQRLLLCEKTVANFASCDAIVSPTSPVVAPPYADYERYLLRLSRNPIIWSLVGAPVISVPCGVGEAGLPVGLQLAAAPGKEQTLADIGVALESALMIGN